MFISPGTSLRSKTLRAMLRIGRTKGNWDYQQWDQWHGQQSPRQRAKSPRQTPQCGVAKDKMYKVRLDHRISTEYDDACSGERSIVPAASSATARHTMDGPHDMATNQPMQFVPQLQADAVFHILMGAITSILRQWILTQEECTQLLQTAQIDAPIVVWSDDLAMVWATPGCFEESHGDYQHEVCGVWF